MYGESELRNWLLIANNPTNVGVKVQLSFVGNVMEDYFLSFGCLIYTYNGIIIFRHAADITAFRLKFNV